MLTICVGIKNRTRLLIEALIASMNSCIKKELLELSIYDCGSLDVPNVEKLLKESWKGPLYYKKSEEPFTRSKSLNEAVKLTKTPWIFLCDADMTLPADFVDQYNLNVSETKSWFPICFSLGRGQERKISPETGWWREKGFGMVGILKSNFLEIGGYNENFTQWGGEDNDLYNRVKGEKIRERCLGLFHNWHESPYNNRTTPPRFR